MKVLGIIPARYQSTRLPGKPLALIGGITMIERVYQRAKLSGIEVLVATDDVRIETAVKKFNGEVIMTAKDHNSGTNRCLEAYQKWCETHEPMDVILNIQGDEPLLSPKELELLSHLFKDPAVQMGTLVKAIETQAELDNRTGCFVTLSKKQEALYFSRQVLPFLRDVPYDDWLSKHTFYKHIGLYGYRPEALKAFAEMAPSSLEQAENLEQNRWLENGGKIKVGFSDKDSLSVDTPADLEAVRKILSAG